MQQGQFQGLAAALARPFAARVQRQVPAFGVAFGEIEGEAFDAAACISCGACVAACPNSAAQLFTAAKVAHLNLLPQGQSERWRRVEAMVDTMEEYFGSCTNHGECQEACPKEISIDYIALMNRDYLKAKFKNRRLAGQR